MLNVSDFHHKLNQLGNLLIQHFPHQYNLDLLQDIALHSSNRQHPIGCIAYSVVMSDFVYETLCKQPDLLHQWWQRCPTLEDCQNYAHRLQQQLESLVTEEQLYRQLRLFRHREMANLSFCQSLNLGTVEDIFIRLSQLAEALIIGARDWLYKRLCQEVGTPMDEQGNPQQLFILGMGKLGGFELNFSSDIDLIFTYPANGETQGARRCIDNAKFFTRLGQRLINALDQYTADGFVYRTDMRLRPFGEDGALALSFNAMEHYYQEQGRDWERYAMIKARILGDQSSPQAQALSQLLRPFIYRRYIDFSVIQSLRNMKQKIEREVRRRGLVDNIKLGAGGIREVEFIVQVFQLIRGGREITLQQRELLKVLPELARLNLLTTEQCEDLRQAYLFLRRTENVLQAIADQQTQQLPEAAIDRQRLVSAMQSYSIRLHSQPVLLCKHEILDWNSFYQQLQQQQNNVRAIFSHLIGDEQQEEESDDSLVDFFEQDWQQHELIQLLNTEHISEQEQDQIFARLEQFKQEVSRRPVGTRGREVLNQLLPKLLLPILQHSQYQTLLSRLLNILEKILTRTTYLELLLEHPIARTQLIQLCAESQMIAELVAQHPILLDELLDQKSLLNPAPFTEYKNELQQYLLRLAVDDEEQLIDALRLFKQAAILRIAAADILGALPVMKVSDHLTYLAEAIIEAVVNLAWQLVSQRFGVPQHLEAGQKGFLIVGYGKLGGIELGYKSDLDLVFLFENCPNSQTQGGKRSIESTQFYLRLAQKILSIFSLNTSAGVLYEVDTRLRPSGEAGMLVSSIQAFVDYQQQEAWTWEKQALVRAREVYGDESLRLQFQQIRQQILSSPRELTQLQQDVINMREKMYQHLSHQNGLFNIKTDQGGITDIEFIAQYLVLAHSATQPALSIWSDNVRIFDSMAEYQVINQEEAQKLKHCYVSLRNRIHHLNLLGLNAETEQSEFSSEREFICSMWKRLLG